MNFKEQEQKRFDESDFQNEDGEIAEYKIQSFLSLSHARLLDLVEKRLNKYIKLEAGSKINITVTEPIYLVPVKVLEAIKKEI